MKHRRRLELTVRSETGGEWTEAYNPADLVDPADLGRHRPRWPRRAVTTDAEAEEYGRKLVESFNVDAKQPREFVSARVVDYTPEEDRAAERSRLLGRLQASSAARVRAQRACSVEPLES